MPRAAWEMDVQVRQALVLECCGTLHVLKPEDVHGIPMITIHAQQQGWLRPLAGTRGPDLSKQQLAAAIGMAMQSVRERIHEERVRSGQEFEAKAEDLKASSKDARTFVGLGASETEEENDTDTPQEEPPARKRRRRRSKPAVAYSKAHRSYFVVLCACLFPGVAQQIRKQ